MGKLILNKYQENKFKMIFSFLFTLILFFFVLSETLPGITKTSMVDMVDGIMVQYIDDIKKVDDRYYTQLSPVVGRLNKQRHIGTKLACDKALSRLKKLLTWIKEPDPKDKDVMVINENMKYVKDYLALSSIRSTQTILTESPKSSKIFRDIAIKFDNHYYLVILDKLSWEEAKVKCEKIGGHLVTIESQNELDFLVRSYSKKNYNCNIWVGVLIQSVMKKGKWQDEWRWISGKTHMDRTPTSLIAKDYYPKSYSGPFVVAGYLDAGFNRIAKTHPKHPHAGIMGFICEWDK